MMRRLFILAVLSMAMLSPAIAEVSAEAFIELQMRNGILTAIPWVKVSEAGQYRYVLKSRVESRSGGSNASSSGTVNLPVRLVRLNASSTHRLTSPGDRFHFSLKVLKGALLIAEDTVHFPE